MTDASPFDLICWDFGDTLVDELFMRLAPDGVDEWPERYEAMVADNAELFHELDLGRASMNDLIEPLAERLTLPRIDIARHLRLVWHRIEWFPAVATWVDRLGAAGVPQAVVTVNPHEFHGMAVACGLDRKVDVIVTSAEIADLRKPPMADRARALLGLPSGLGTTLLIDNKRHNTDDFSASGGHGLHFSEETFEREAERYLTPLLGDHHS